MTLILRQTLTSTVSVNALLCNIPVDRNVYTRA